MFLNKMKAHHVIYRTTDSQASAEGSGGRRGAVRLPPSGLKVTVKKGHPRPIEVIVARNKQGGGRKMLTTIQGLEAYDVSSHAVEKEVSVLSWVDNKNQIKRCCEPWASNGSS